MADLLAAIKYHIENGAINRTICSNSHETWFGSAACLVTADAVLL